jgi:hypothetical protein
MGRPAWAAAVLVAAGALLGACSKQADSNPNAPGSPGTGNTSEVVRPAAPDGPPGGPSGIAGSAPHTGGSGADAPVGTTGRGLTDPGGRSQTAQPGVGLHGGLGGGNVMGSSAAPGTSGASVVPDGSSNTTPGSAVGRR